jgi:hypothetical protein
MPSNFAWRKTGCFGVLSAILTASSATSWASAQKLPSEYNAQIKQQAALAAAQPAKVSAKLIATEILVGSNAEVEITLLNAENLPVAAKQDWHCEVSIHYRSGKSSTQTTWIKKGEASGNFEFVAAEAGLVTLNVSPMSGGLRPDKLTIIVRPTQAPSKKKKSVPANSALPSIRTYPTALSIRTGGQSAGLKLASLALAAAPNGSSQNPQIQGATTKKAAVLHLSVSDVGGNYFANGRDAAVITAVYEGADLSPAPADIHVWFHWADGYLDPQPLQILKGAYSGTTKVTSLRPADVQVNFVSSTPSYEAQGDTQFTVHFVPPMAVLIGPEKLSVVDNSPVMIVFLDAQNNPVAPGKNWAVTLRSHQSKLHFAPQSFEVQGTSPSGTSALFPVALGSDTVEAVMANYQLQSRAIVITGWLVLALCLGGGLAGGLAAYNKFRGSWLWRIFLGILGGAVLSWLYVYLALPNVSSNLAHNTFSVFFVSVLGGYLGTTVLDIAAKRFGWISS